VRGHPAARTDHGDRSSSITLAEERIEHAPAVERLLDAAYGEARWRKTSQRLRDGRAPVRGLSLVALDRDGLIGTVRLWRVLAGGCPALLLGPLAVDPAWRKRGIGAALIEETLRRATEAGEDAVLLVGDAPYYGRFGFTSDLTRDLWLPGPVERARFLARELRPGALEGANGAVLAA
jgi:predicted N-acetyltransferase YhbS